MNKFRIANVATMSFAAFVALTLTPQWVTSTVHGPLAHSSAQAKDMDMEAVPTLTAEGIRTVQQALQKKGFDPGPIDGIVGPQTEQAVRKFRMPTASTRAAASTTRRSTRWVRRNWPANRSHSPPRLGGSHSVRTGWVSAIAVTDCSIPSFRGRQHWDRCYAPSEHRLHERSPESITTGPAVATRRIHHAPWGYGFPARWQVGKTDVPAPRNDTDRPARNALMPSP